MALTLKKQYAKTVVGFNGSGKPLGDRDDLHVLAEMAKASKDTYILSMFEEIPTQQEIAAKKEAAFHKKQEAKKKVRK